MTANADIEEIQLTATHVEEPHETGNRPLQLRFELTQRNSSRGIEKQIGVGGDSRLYVSDRAVRRQCEFDIALASLDPEPLKTLSIAYAWGYSALVAALLAMGHYLVLNTTVAAYLPYPVLPVLILLATLGTVSLLGLVYSSRYHYTYRTRHGGLPLISLLYERPDRDTFRDFLSRLSGSIREAQRAEEHDADGMLANELREHRHLKEAGAITPTAYEAAKARILARHG